MAHKKGMGSSKNGRDTAGRRLGVKRHSDNIVKPGMIILRQRGTKIKPGLNTGMGKDHTIFSKIQGKVNFRKTNRSKTVNVTPV